jgi:hypothetical protein
MEPVEMTMRSASCKEISPADLPSLEPKDSGLEKSTEGAIEGAGALGRPGAPIAKPDKPSDWLIAESLALDALVAKLSSEPEQAARTKTEAIAASVTRNLFIVPPSPFLLGFQKE